MRETPPGLSVLFGIKRSGALIDPCDNEPSDLSFKSVRFDARLRDDLPTASAVPHGALETNEMRLLEVKPSSSVDGTGGRWATSLASSSRGLPATFAPVERATTVQSNVGYNSQREE